MIVLARSDLALVEAANDEFACEPLSPAKPNPGQLALGDKRNDEPSAAVHSAALALSPESRT